MQIIHPCFATKYFHLKNVDCPPDIINVVMTITLRDPARMSVDEINLMYAKTRFQIKIRGCLSNVTLPQI